MKLKNLTLIFLLILIKIVCFGLPSNANSKYASIIIEEHSGKILYSRSADQLRYPASMTKVMN